MQITTEITSSKIASDNPIHQRLLFAYEAAQKIILGSVLEVGCGEGRGLEVLSQSKIDYTALDKNEALLNHLSQKYPSYHFIHTNVPPFAGIKDNSFDFVIAFQVIEHIANDQLFIQEIHRVLKPRGKAIITTPNIDLTLSRNPWHEREYTWQGLEKLLGKCFSSINSQGITGNESVWEYYKLNKESVRKIMKWDILNLQYRLPASILRTPYDILNRRNRNKMMSEDNSLVAKISTKDYTLSSEPSKCFDLFFIAQKS